jgi:starvation-inducible DNA-binding protein
MASKTLIDKLNQNIADLHILYVKLHNLHWNISGMQFFQIHAVTEGYYTYIGELYDTVAERVLQLGAKPLSTVKGYLQHAKIQDDARTSFTPEDVLAAVSADFNYLASEYKEIQALAESEKDATTATIASDQIAWLEKALWMVGTSQN